MEDCIFCKLANGIIPTNVVYEDDNIMAFMDNNPVTPGHTLIVPKKHILDLDTIDLKDLSIIMENVKKLAKLIVNKMNAQGCTIVQNNGIAQEVKHFHVHIIPKYENDFKMSIEEAYKKITSK